MLENVVNILVTQWNVDYKIKNSGDNAAMEHALKKVDEILREKVIKYKSNIRRVIAAADDGYVDQMMKKKEDLMMKVVMILMRNSKLEIG